jgi:YgiT-type zinc finger domain-containing protein
MKENEMATLEEMLEGIVCPRCGRENTYVVRQVDQIVPVGGDVVTVTVMAGECTYCGERLLDTRATEKLDEAVEKVRQHHAAGLTRTGVVYHVA